MARARTWLSALADEYPHAWVLVGCAVAWLAMVRHWLAPGVTCHQLSAASDARDFLLMIVAMMLPAMGESMRWVAARSFRSRRRRAVAGYVVGYLAPWLLVALGVAWLRGHRWAHASRLPAEVFLAAALWSATPLYRWLITASHRTIPLAPLGVRADLDCLRFALAQSVPCAAACGPLMVACALTGHGVIAMLGGTVLGLLERRSFRPRPWLVPVGCLALAAWYAAPTL